MAQRLEAESTSVKVNVIVKAGISFLSKIIIKKLDGESKKLFRMVEKHSKNYVKCEADINYLNITIL